MIVYAACLGAQDTRWGGDGFIQIGAGDLAALRRDADFAAGRFSAAMLRRSASIRFTTFSAAGFTEAG
jgi:hypothetical protein